MSEKDQETQANIIAEMRMGKPVGPCAYRIGLPDKEEVYESGAKRRITMIKDVIVQELADRFEAAAKREKAQPGNAAAMREALVAIRKALFRDSGMGPTTAFHAEVDRLTSTALSAPPRNCDVYKTSWDVVTHWDGGLDSAKSVGRMLDWLLAPAKAERKGECDGR